MLAGRYRLVDSLGHGGMGEVFRAEDNLLGRQVAVKMLLPHRRDPFAAARFEREARAAAQINCPHVVEAYDFGRHEGSLYLVMELVEGHSVAHELALHGPLPPERALDIIRQAAVGLAAAHEHQIIHRDIKPGNLLLAPDGTVKVTDFGIALFVNDATTTVTATGHVLGTSHYLAPERAEGRPARAASDVYALGCVLYQLLTGHPPFMGDQPASVMYQHVQATPVPPSELRPEAAGACEDLLLRMLAKNPSHRPTAAQVAEGNLPEVAVVTMPLPTRKTPRRQVLLAATGAVLIALAGTTGAMLLDRDNVRLPETTELRPPNPSATTPAQSRPTTRPTTQPPSVRGTKTTAPARTTETQKMTAKATTKSTKPPKAEPSEKPAKSKKPEKPGKTKKPKRT